MHLEPPQAGADLVAIPADIPASVAISRLGPSQLPADWRDYPAPESLADLGMRWARAGTTAMLAVPSAIIPQELNYLFNPGHPAFREIRIGVPEPFALDPRMWKRSPSP